MQEVMSKHGLLNIEELNSSHPSSLVLFAEVLRQNTSQEFLPAYQIRRVFTSASQHWKVTFIFHHAYLKKKKKKYCFQKPCAPAMNCKTFKSRAIHNLPVCLHFTVFKPSNRGWNLTAGIWFYSAIRALVRSTCGQQTCSQPAFSSQRSRLGWRSRLCAGRSVLATLNLDKHYITFFLVKNIITGWALMSAKKLNQKQGPQHLLKSQIPPSC